MDNENKPISEADKAAYLAWKARRRTEHLSSVSQIAMVAFLDGRESTVTPASDLDRLKRDIAEKMEIIEHRCGKAVALEILKEHCFTERTSLHQWLRAGMAALGDYHSTLREFEEVLDEHLDDSPLEPEQRIPGNDGPTIRETEES